MSGAYRYIVCVPILDLVSFQAPSMSGEVIMLHLEICLKLLIYCPFGEDQLAEGHLLDRRASVRESYLKFARWQSFLSARLWETCEAWKQIWEPRGKTLRPRIYNSIRSMVLFSLMQTWLDFSSDSSDLTSANERARGGSLRRGLWCISHSANSTSEREVWPMKLPGSCNRGISQNTCCLF